MKITVEIPVVAEYAARECSYNAGRACHAKAITIGQGVHPGCDTFLHMSTPARERQRRAGVGACKVIACRFNDDLECGANAISVGGAVRAISCLTFVPRL
ncbi:MAG: DUF1540 domain-containing protein [Gammaproteobacteria bacterium]|nr:DUF1540 domain-containing protein [Gammaproteobacteria bacterium]